MGFDGTAEEMARELWFDREPTQKTIAQVLEEAGFEPIPNAKPMGVYTHQRYGVQVSSKQNSMRLMGISAGKFGSAPLKIHDYVAKVISDYHLIMERAKQQTMQNK